MAVRRKKKKTETEVVSNDPHPRSPVAWGNLIEDVLTIDDPASEAERLREELEIGDDRTNYAIVIVHVDRAASNLYAAKRLARAAKIEDERFVAECEERLEILRTRAREEIVELKNDGKHKGAITKQQIEDQILSNWPNEYRTIKERVAKMHGATRALEGLVDAWNHRCVALNKMLERAALGRIVSGGGK